MLALLLLIAAAPAHAGVAAIEGNEIVYRGDAQRDAFYAEGTADAVTFRGDVDGWIRLCAASPSSAPAPPRCG